MKDAAIINWKKCVVYPKYQGVLVTLFWIESTWIATVGQRTSLVPQVDLVEQFWKFWEISEFELPRDTSKCFMFVMNFGYSFKMIENQPSLIFIGTRDNRSHKEIEPESFSEMNWTICSVIPNVQPKSRNQLEMYLASLSPFDMIGCVVRDDDYQRCVVHHPSYLIISQFLKKYFVDESAKQFQLDILSLVRTMTNSKDSDRLFEILKNPKVKRWFQNIRNKLIEHSEQVDKVYSTLKCEDAREFVEKVRTIQKENRFLSKILFEMRHQNSTAFQIYTSNSLLSDPFIVTNLHQRLFETPQEFSIDL